MELLLMMLVFMGVIMLTMRKWTLIRLRSHVDLFHVKIHRPMLVAVVAVGLLPMAVALCHWVQGVFLVVIKALIMMMFLESPNSAYPRLKVRLTSKSTSIG